MKYTEETVRRILQLKNLELISWTGNTSSGTVTYKKLKDGSIHTNNRPDKFFSVMRKRYKEQMEAIFRGNVIEQPPITPASPEVTKEKKNPESFLDSCKMAYIKYNPENRCHIIKCNRCNEEYNVRSDIYKKRNNNCRKCYGYVGKVTKPLTNFTVIEYRGVELGVKSRYKCLSCGKEVEMETRKVKEKRVMCSHCGNYEGCSPLPNTILENCKVTKNNPKHYVSKDGQVYSIKGKFKQLKPIKSTRSNHLYIHDSSGETEWIHRLVLEAWGYPQPSVRHIVRHKNDIPDDNRLENLEWGLHIENTKDKEVNEKERIEIIKRIHGAGFTPEEISVATKIKLDCVESILK